MGEQAAQPAAEAVEQAAQIVDADARFWREQAIAWGRNKKDMTSHMVMMRCRGNAEALEEAAKKIRTRLSRTGEAS